MIWLATAFTPASAVEWCNALDDDGDGLVDEGPVVIGEDADGDGYAASERLAPSCTLFDLPAGDCDDTNSGRFPDPANEACNGTDGDCDGVVDDATCPCPLVATDSRAWLLCADEVDWPTADAECRIGNYKLASLASSTSQSQAELAIATAYGSGIPYWIGYNDRSVEGSFVWSDGSDPVSFTNWRMNEPNNGGGDTTNEDCAEIEWTGLWDDQSCSDPQPYLCEAGCEVRSYSPDEDGDGLGDAAAPSMEQCAAPDPGWVLNALDCDDRDAGLPAVGYADEDGDGAGTGDALVSCERVAEAADDCDDADPDVSPDHAEVACNGVDDDCDRATEDVADGDEDGVDTCDDCDDTDPDVFPGAPDDPADGVDSDCDGTPEVVDQDRDGLADVDEAAGDTDGDGVPDVLDPDSDDDGALDGVDPAVLDPGGGDLAPGPDSDFGFGLGCDVGSARGGWTLVLALSPWLRRRR